MTRMFMERFAWSERRSPRGLSAIFAILLVTAMLTWSHLAAAAEPYREDVVKAAFIYRFTGYMDWPAEALKNDNFTIAIMGGDSVADELNKLATQHPIKNLPVRVRNIDAARQAVDAQILYIGANYAGNLQELIESVATLPVLVVTDRPTGLDDGSAVNFMLIDRRVRFEVSLAAARRAGIKVSSELLAVAARVRGSSLKSGPLCVPPLNEMATWIGCSPKVAAL
jgi:hypothetical protein